MDFVKLHKPYEGEDSPSPETQMKWLLKQGIPQDVVARAMLVVYAEIEGGKIFEKTDKHSAGWSLCQYLLKTAKELHQQAVSAYLTSLEEADKKRRNDIKESLLKSQPKTFFQRVKAVFSDPYKNV